MRFSDLDFSKVSPMFYWVFLGIMTLFVLGGIMTVAVAFSYYDSREKYRKKLKKGDIVRVMCFMVQNSYVRAKVLKVEKKHGEVVAIHVKYNEEDSNDMAMKVMNIDGSVEFDPDVMAFPKRISPNLVYPPDDFKYGGLAGFAEKVCSRCFPGHQNLII